MSSATTTRFGSSIHYEALVDDHAGNSRHFDVSWPCEDEVITALRSIIVIDDSEKKSKVSQEGIEKATDVVGKALMGAKPYILDAGPWYCRCGRPATEVHHSPLLQEEKLVLGIVVDKPEMICNDPACKQRALESKLAEHAAQKKGYKMTCIYTCRCGKQGCASEMRRCGTCKLAWYCSDGCKEAHIRDGHSSEP